MQARTLFLIRSSGPLWDSVEATIAAFVDATVLGVTHSAHEAREVIPRLRPELVLCGSTVEGISALPLLAELRSALPEAKLVVFGADYTQTELVELTRLQVRAVLGWDSLNDETFSQAHDALRSGTFAVWDRSILETAFEALFELSRNTASPPAAESFMPVSILIIDSNEFTCISLRTLLSEDKRFTIVGHTARNGASLARQLQPTLILIDPAGAGQLDIELVAQLTAAAPSSRICIRTSFFDPKLVVRVLEVGALAYFLTADADTTFLYDALALVGQYGASITSPGVVVKFRALQERLRMHINVSEPEEMRISVREREVLDRLAQGFSDKEIAVQLGVSRTTVETYILRLRVRLGANTRTQLMVLAIWQGLLEG